jgi:NPCBM/NEW2 domain
LACAETPWPHSIPRRIHDGENPDLFVMTLGDVDTPIADRVFDPMSDTLKDGGTRTNYYRDTLGVHFYQPLGRESPRAGEARFTLASLVPEKISLTQLESRRSTGRWRGFEIEDLLPGGRPSIAGATFDQALTAFPNSEVEFDLHGLYRKFTTQVGVEAGFSTNTAARFIVLGDGKELWRSESVKPADGATCADVDITGVEKLVLRTASGQGASRRGRTRIVWGDPTVSKPTNKTE